MAFSFSLDDVAYLSSPAGNDALAAAGVLALTDASLLADLTRLRRSLGDRAAAVVETVRLRRRAAARMGPAAASWLFTDEALQQASPWPVARHRAQRLAGLGVHDLTCSIGADLAALAAAGPVAVGSDLDPVRLAMAGHNLAASGLPARLLVADALTRTTRGLLGYADPARRTSTGRRITSADTVPSIAELDARPRRTGRRYCGCRPGWTTTRSPGPERWRSSRWTGSPGRRCCGRPSSPRSAAGPPSCPRPAPPEEVTSADPDDAGVGPVDAWLVDPDPAVVRAHLVRHWAARHGLWLLDPHLAYLTGPAPAGPRPRLPGAGRRAVHRADGGGAGCAATGSARWRSCSVAPR